MLKPTSIDAFVNQQVKVDFIANMTDTLGTGASFTLLGVTEYGILLNEVAVSGQTQNATNALSYFYPWNVVGRIALIGNAGAARSAA